MLLYNSEKVLERGVFGRDEDADGGVGGSRGMKKDGDGGDGRLCLLAALYGSEPVSEIVHTYYYCEIQHHIRDFLCRPRQFWRQQLSELDMISQSATSIFVFESYRSA